MKTLLLSTAAVLALSSAANATVFSCAAPQFSVGRQSVDPQDTVDQIEIRHAPNSRDWQVNHTFRNGMTVMRQDQYKMTDASTPTVWTWRGQLRKNGSITMVGELRQDQQGRPYYTETQSDGNRVTMRTTSICSVVTEAELQQKARAAAEKRIAEIEADRQKKAAIQAAAEAERQRALAEIEAAERKQKLAQQQAEFEARLAREKAESEAKMAREKAEWEAKVAREKAEFEAQQARIRDILLNGKDDPSIKKVIVPLKVRANAMRLNIGLGDQVLTMLLDTGASSTMITNSLALSLIQNDQAKFVGDTKMMTASGQAVPAREIIIYEVRIGDLVARNVKALAISADVDLLLGANVLNTIGPYLIDSQKSQLIFAVASKSETAEN